MSKLIKRFPQLLACLLVGGLACLAQAEVYTYIDATGNRVYTDQPKPGAKRIDMAPTNAVPFAKSGSILKAAPPTVPVAPLYQVLRILFPTPDSASDDPAGNLIVTINSEPPLLPTHSYRLLLDGKDTGQTGRSAVFDLQNLDRGTHQLAVEIIDSQGQTVERTPNQPVHIRRASYDSKRRARPCQLPEYGVRPECPLKDKPKPDNDIPFIPFI